MSLKLQFNSLIIYILLPIETSLITLPVIVII